MRIAGQLVMLLRIYSAVREVHQSKIGRKISTSNTRVQMNPNFRESGLHIIPSYILTTDRSNFMLLSQAKDLVKQLIHVNIKLFNY